MDQAAQAPRVAQRHGSVLKLGSGLRGHTHASLSASSTSPLDGKAADDELTAFHNRCDAMGYATHDHYAQPIAGQIDN